MKHPNSQFKPTVLAIASIFVLTIALFAQPASANITLAEYMALRAEAHTGNKGAEARETEDR